MNWIEESISSYYKWLKDNTQYRDNLSSGWNVISTPFYGLFNDPIEVYVKKDGNNILLSDDGLTLRNLELCGVNFTHSAKRKEWLRSILLNYGITYINGELTAVATHQDFAQKKHNLISAISEISDMEMMSNHVVTSLFKEDVKNLLNEQELIFTPQFIAKGDTGIDFTFDFQIAGRKKEIVLKTFNTLNKTNVPNFLFAWEDIKPARERVTGKNLSGLAIINDKDKEIKSELLTALQTKGADFILWSERYEPKNLVKLSA